MSNPRILVAGVGNIFLGDDAFGVEVAQRLIRRPLPEGVRVVDFGIRGLDLTYALLDGYEAVILVDAMPRGQTPGTLYVLQPEAGETSEAPTPLAPGPIDVHGLDPVQVLRLVRSLGGQIERLLVVGCEPATLEHEEDMSMELSEPVRAAADEAVNLVESLIEKLLAEGRAVTVPGEEDSSVG
jgi:hydrogenase maturation protease